MSWKKVNGASGISYVINNFQTKIHYTKDLSIDDFNNKDREFNFTKNQSYICEYVDEIGETLPNGVYVLKADHSFDNPCLFPMTPSHDACLFELDVVKNILEDFRLFLGSREVYDRLGILYKRGVLLYGPPGTGKTTAIQMIINSIRPTDSIVIYIPKEIPTDLITELKAEKRLKILIFEELTNTIKETNVGRFLTFLDGENSTNNTYVLATTNYPETLPGNVVDRPGRFDKLYLVEHLSVKDRKIYLEHLLGRKATKEEIEISKDTSIAAIKELLLLMQIEGLTAPEASAKIKGHQNLVKKDFKKASGLGFDHDDDE